MAHEHRSSQVFTWSCQVAASWVVMQQNSKREVKVQVLSSRRSGAQHLQCSWRWCRRGRAALGASRCGERRTLPAGSRQCQALCQLLTALLHQDHLDRGNRPSERPMMHQYQGSYQGSCFTFGTVKSYFLSCFKWHQVHSGCKEVNMLAPTPAKTLDFRIDSFLEILNLRLEEIIGAIVWKHISILLFWHFQICTLLKI